MFFKVGIFSNNYHWEDYPDGSNCLYKTACLTRDTSYAGLALGVWDVINLTKPSNIGQALTVFPKYMAPAVASGVVFGITTCTLTQMRQKDDQVNYFGGGVAAGSIIGGLRRSFAVGVPTAAFLGIAAMLYKHARMNDFTFFPEVKHERTSYIDLLPDWTMYKERPKYTGFERE